MVQAVRHMRMMNSEIGKVVSMREDELFEIAKQLQVPFDLVAYVHENGKLPVVNFAAGGVATPADAAFRYLQIRQSGEESKCDCESGYELYRCKDDRQII